MSALDSLESGEKPRYDWTDGAAFGAAWVPALLGYAFQWNSYGMNYVSHPPDTRRCLLMRFLSISLGTCSRTARMEREW